MEGWRGESILGIKYFNVKDVKIRWLLALLLLKMNRPISRRVKSSGASQSVNCVYACAALWYSDIYQL